MLNFLGWGRRRTGEEDGEEAEDSAGGLRFRLREGYRARTGVVVRVTARCHITNAGYRTTYRMTNTPSRSLYS